MRFIPLFLTAVAICLSTELDTAASNVSGDIAGRGAKAVADEMDHGKGRLTWFALADHVATGNSNWVRVAAQLRPYADAGNAESLDNSLAEALPKAPKQVLRVMPPFRPNRICTGGQFIEAPKLKVQSYLEQARSVLRSVDDVRLARAKKACLSEIDTSLRNLAQRSDQ